MTMNNHDPFSERLGELSPEERKHVDTAKDLLKKPPPDKTASHVEALLQLRRITPCRRAHPIMLLVHAQILLAAGKFRNVEKIARRVTVAAPEIFMGFMLLATALELLGRVEEAFNTIAGVKERFLYHRLLYQEMGHYLVKLGRKGEARQWLVNALKFHPDPREAAAEPWFRYAFEGDNPLWQ
jgi:hypothetical protein